MRTDFGDRLRALRQARKLSQQKLGLLLGYEPNQAQHVISRWERGAKGPAPKQLGELAARLDLTDAEIVALVRGTLE